MSNLKYTDQTALRAVSADRPFLPFTRPSIDEDDIAAVVKVLESGWITSGAVVEELEKSMSALTGCAHSVAVSSATAGMHLIIHALGIGPGDEVITPSMTWVSTVNLIVLSGATPVFVDIDRNTLMCDANGIEHAITDKTRLIIPVHFAGAPFDLEAVHKVARRHDIPLVEDAAHALGSSYKGTPVGQAGTAVFSLQAIKNVTSAEGGVVCTDDPGLAERVRRTGFHGLGANSWARESQGRTPVAEVLEPGYKYNLPDMNAALALGQLRRLDKIIRDRARIARQYRDAFESMASIYPLELPGYAHSHAWHLFSVRIDTDALGLSRDQFMGELRQRQIGTGIHFRAVHTQEFYAKNSSGRERSLPNTEWNAERIVTLPMFPDMTSGDVDRVINGVEEIVQERSA